MIRDRDIWVFIGFVVLGIALVVALPFATIASLNTLFGLSIAYTWKTWLAAFWLGVLVYGSTTK